MSVCTAVQSGDCQDFAFIKPKPLCGVQGLLHSLSMVQTPVAVWCHQLPRQPDLLSETADVGWGTSKSERTALHVSPLFWWVSSATGLTGSVTHHSWADQLRGLSPPCLSPSTLLSDFLAGERSRVRLVNFSSVFAVAAENTVVVSSNSVPSGL